MNRLPLFLRAPRAAGLWLIGVLIPVATLAALVLSYRGLFDWARTHSWPWYLAPLFPLLIDVLIVAGEVVLFAAAIDGKTPRRVRAAAWGIVIVFTVLSVVGNVSHAATPDMLTRGGWGLPPIVLAVALGFGLGELKRQAAKYREDVAGVSESIGLAGAPATPPAVTPRVTPAVTVPPIKEIRARRNCSPETAQKVQAELRRLIRSLPDSPAGAPADTDGTAQLAPAGANLNGRHP